MVILYRGIIVQMLRLTPSTCRVIYTYKQPFDNENNKLSFNQINQRDNFKLLIYIICCFFVCRQKPDWSSGYLPAIFGVPAVIVLYIYPGAIEITNFNN